MTIERRACGSIAPLHAAGDVFLAGQPEPEDFERIRALGVKTIINQRPAAELHGFDEGAHVTSLGMAYANPAFGSPDELTDGVIDATLEALRSAERPVMMHCASANRTGALWMAYRVIEEGLGMEAALTEAKIVGLRSPEYERIVSDYITRHR